MPQKYLDVAGLQHLWGKVMTEINTINSTISSFATTSDVSTLTTSINSLLTTAGAKALVSSVSSLQTSVNNLVTSVAGLMLASNVETNGYTIGTSNGELTFTNSDYSSNTKVPKVSAVAGAINTMVGESSDTTASLNGKVNKSQIKTTLTTGTSDIPSCSIVNSTISGLNTTLSGKLTKTDAASTYATKAEVAQVMEYKGSDTIANVIAKLTANGVSDTIIGDVYNISNSFTVSSSNKASFVEYASSTDSNLSVNYPAGTNVVIVKVSNAYKLDILTGAFAFETLSDNEIDTALSTN